MGPDVEGEQLLVIEGSVPVDSSDCHSTCGRCQSCTVGARVVTHLERPSM